MSKIIELQKKMKALKAEMKKEGKVALKAAFKDLFEKHPVLEAVQWEQYTPYFNDGDSCTFSVYDMYPVFVLSEEQKKIIKDSSKDYKEGDEDDDQMIIDQLLYDYGELKGTMTASQKAANKALTKLVKDLGDMDETFEDIFGDHVRVRATKKGFKVTEFEHD